MSEERRVALVAGAVESIIGRIPAGRPGLAQEIAAAVACLVSNAVGFAPGSDLSINGGQHMY